MASQYYNGYVVRIISMQSKMILYFMVTKAGSNFIIKMKKATCLIF